MDRKPSSPVRRVNRRWLLRSVAALVAVPLLASCGQQASPAAKPAETKPAESKPVEAKPAAQQAPAAQAKPFAGRTLNVVMFDHTYPRALKDRLPQFTDLTGIKVEMDTPGFPVYNQRADLELSTGSGAFDVMTMTFIFSGKWIGAGWATRLNDFINKDTTLGADDFLPGAMAPMKGGNDVFALPFVAESTLMVYRKDIFENTGLKPPETFDELLANAPKLQSGETKAFMGRGQNGWHWIWPNVLQAYGGNFFADPPTDMTPLLATPESIKSADVLGTLTRDFSVLGAQNFTEQEASGAMMEGKAAVYFDAMAWVGLAADPKSKVKDQVAFTLPPGGSAGRFPQLATHGIQIPASAKQKEVSWEFLKWATSRDMMSQIAEATTYPAVTRASVLSDPKFKQKYNWAGADIGALHAEVLKLAGSGYMAYRTVPEFPPIGDRVSIALSEIATGQKSAEQAMKDAQRDVESILEKAGHKIKKS